jgi:hypothetical protein
MLPTRRLLNGSTVRQRCGLLIEPSARNADRELARRHPRPPERRMSVSGPLVLTYMRSTQLGESAPRRTLHNTSEFFATSHDEANPAAVAAVAAPDSRSCRHRFPRRAQDRRQDRRPSVLPSVSSPRRPPPRDQAERRASVSDGAQHRAGGRSARAAQRRTLRVGGAKPLFPRTQPLTASVPARLERDELGRPKRGGTCYWPGKMMATHGGSFRFDAIERFDRAPTPNSSLRTR